MSSRIFSLQICESSTERNLEFAESDDLKRSPFLKTTHQALGNYIRQAVTTLSDVQQCGIIQLNYLMMVTDRSAQRIRS